MPNQIEKTTWKAAAGQKLTIAVESEEELIVPSVAVRVTRRVRNAVRIR
jgi:hypothetical protein